MRFKFLFFLIYFFCFSGSVLAETLVGVVENVHPSKTSFALNGPPLVRVYVNRGTQFSEGSIGNLQLGSKVEVEATKSSNGLFIAKRVSVLSGGNLPSHDLRTHFLDVELDQEFFLGVAQTAKLKDGKKEITFFAKDFINTMCKDGYDCINEGVVGMQIEVTRGGKKKEIELVSINTRKPIQPTIEKVFDYIIYLNECGEDVVSLTIRKK